MLAKYSAFLIAFIAAIAVPALSRSADLGPVHFVGNEIISTQNLKRELESNPDYFLAAYQRGPLTKLKQLVETLTDAGYHHSGFPDTTVNASIEQADGAECLRVKINEGKRYRNSSIRVTGVNSDLTQLIIERLSRGVPQGNVYPTFVTFNGRIKSQWKQADGKDAKMEDATWKPSEFTDFTRGEKLNSSVAQVVRSLGLQECEVTSSIELDKDSGNAHLNVNVRNAIEHRADKIQVSGLYEQRDDDVLNYLKLKRGDVVDTARIHEMTWQLWKSGRFKHQYVHWDQWQQNTLCFDLELVPDVPWLSEPLDEKGQTVLKFVQWFSECNKRGEDIKVCDKDYAAIVSPTSAYLSANYSKGSDDEQSQRNRVQAVIGPDGIRIDHSGSPTCINIPPPNAKLSLSTFISVKAEQSFLLPGDENESGLFETHQKIFFVLEEADGSPIYFTIGVVPSDLLSIAYRKDLTYKIDETTLTISGLGTTLKLEKETGKLLDFQSKSCKIEVGQGLLDAAKGGIVDKPNSFEVAKPVESLAAAICQPQWWQALESTFDKPLNPHVRTAIPKLAKFDICETFNEVTNLLFESRQGFSIPYRTMASNNELSKFLSFVALSAGSYFPKDSWPTHVAAAQVMLLNGKHFDAATIVENIQNDPKNGPICLAVLAFLLKQNDEPRTNAVASEGLKRISEENIERDLSLIKELLPQRALDNVFTVLNSLSDEEFDALHQLIPVPFVRETLQTIHHNEPNQAVVFNSKSLISEDSLLCKQLHELSEVKIESKVPESWKRFTKFNQDTTEKKDSKDSKGSDEPKSIFPKLPWE